MNSNGDPEIYQVPQESAWGVLFLNVNWKNRPVELNSQSSTTWSRRASLDKDSDASIAEDNKVRAV